MKRLKISLILMIAAAAVAGTAFAAPQRMGVLTDSDVGTPSRVAVDAQGSVYVSDSFGSDSVKTRPGWERLAALTQIQVYPFDDNLVSRPGPRLVDGLEQLAKLLHRELFQ